MDNRTVTKPIQRGYLRKLVGREFFILKRRMNWVLGAANFTRLLGNINLEYSLIVHRSVLLRQLKDVEMYLQHNKITNLRLAAGKISGVVIKPGETFSLWRLVGRPCKAKGYLEG